MKKLFTILAAIGLSAGAANANAERVSLSLHAPSHAVAGGVFDVTLTIAHQNVTGFARFHQDLPKGFEAEQVSVSNEGDAFSFNDQRLRLIWADLPPTPTISVNYRIRVTEPRLAGNLVLGGRFTYVIGDERYAIDLDNTVVAVSAADPAQAISIEAFQGADAEPFAALPVAAIPAAPAIPAAVNMAVPEESVFVVRQTPYMVDGVYYVNLQVTKSALNAFGKIDEELIAQNVTIEEIETKGALFSIEGGKISFAWTSLPPDNDFVISYKVTPWQPVTQLGARGVFSFRNGDVERSVPVVERDVDFSRHVPVPPLSAAQPLQQVQVQPPQQQQRPAMQRGLVFTVQLLATRESVGDQAAIAAYFAQRNVNEPVIEDIQTFDPTGFIYKYVIGPYRRYEQAAVMRDIMWSRGIFDAFVTCYYNGNRITIQEAMMISNRNR